MSQHSKRSVFIVNPISDRNHTSRRSAGRYVNQGRARWVRPDAIEFLAADPRHQAAASGMIGASAPHSPRLEVIQRSIGEYRNRVLGLPNFVGFVKDQGTHSRKIAA